MKRISFLLLLGLLIFPIQTFSEENSDQNVLRKIYTVLPELKELKRLNEKIYDDYEIEDQIVSRPDPTAKEDVKKMYYLVHIGKHTKIDAIPHIANILVSKNLVLVKIQDPKDPKKTIDIHEWKAKFSFRQRKLVEFSGMIRSIRQKYGSTEMKQILQKKQHTRKKITSEEIIKYVQETYPELIARLDIIKKRIQSYEGKFTVERKPNPIATSKLYASYYVVKIHLYKEEWYKIYIKDTFVEEDILFERSFQPNVLLKSLGFVEAIGASLSQ